MEQPALIEDEKWTQGFHTYEGREQLLRWAFEYLQVQTSRRQVSQKNWDRIARLVELLKGSPSHQHGVRLVEREIARIKNPDLPSSGVWDPSQPDRPIEVEPLNQKYVVVQEAAVVETKAVGAWLGPKGLSELLKTGKVEIDAGGAFGPDVQKLHLWLTPEAQEGEARIEKAEEANQKHVVVEPPSGGPKEKWRANYVPSPHYYHLNQACSILDKAFEGYDSFGTYLVGSSLKRRDWRDVDVRMILPDEEFNRLFGTNNANWANALWSLMCTLISDWLSKQSSLPIDFQIQRHTEANTDHPVKEGHPRSALGIFLDYPGKRPSPT